MRALPYLTRLMPPRATGPGMLTPPRRPITLPSDLVDPDDPALHPFTTPHSDPDPGPTPMAGTPGTGRSRGPDAGTGDGSRPADPPVADDRVRSLQDSGWWDDAPGPGAGGPHPTVRPDPGPSRSGRRSTDPDRATDAPPTPGPPGRRPVPAASAGPRPDPHRVPEAEVGAPGHPATGPRATEGRESAPPDAPPTPPTPPTDLMPRTWEWATGQPLDLGPLALPGPAPHQATLPGVAPPPPADPPADPATAPALDRGPRPRSGTPEPERPTLTIGSIEVTVVPPPPAVPALAPAPPTTATAARPPERPTRPSTGSWYGMAQS
jgi:hypothetical protein